MIEKEYASILVIVSNYMDADFCLGDTIVLSSFIYFFVVIFVHHCTELTFKKISTQFFIGKIGKIMIIVDNIEIISCTPLQGRRIILLTIDRSRATNIENHCLRPCYGQY